MVYPVLMGKAMMGVDGSVRHSLSLNIRLMITIM